jgi:hypothetical protein
LSLDAVLAQYDYIDAWQTVEVVVAGVDGEAVRCRGSSD